MNYTKGIWKVTLGGTLMPKDQRIIHAELGLERGIMNVRTICRTFDNATTEESLGNAQLISAAPDMYEALKAVLIFDTSIWRKDDPLRTIIKQALAKAEGG